MPNVSPSAIAASNTRRAVAASPRAQCGPPLSKAITAGPDHAVIIARSVSHPSVGVEGLFDLD